MSWKHLKGTARQLWGRLTGNDAEGAARKASEQRLAEWRERQHKVDPIHR